MNPTFCRSWQAVNKKGNHRVNKSIVAYDSSRRCGCAMRAKQKETARPRQESTSKSAQVALTWR